MRSITFTTLSAALLATALTGCGRDNVQVYHVGTNDQVLPQAPAIASGGATPMPASMPAGLPAPDNSGLPKLKYTLPEGWKEKALCQMRVASFECVENGKTADTSVIPLGGISGGDVANVNRWRGQVGLTSLDAADVAKLAEKVTIADKPGDLYDLSGTTPGSGDEERILAGVLHGDDATWYFKMTGDAALVEKQKANFIAFLKSVDFGKLAPPSTMDMTKLPASHPAIPGMETAAPVADSGDHPAWTVPAGWQPGQLAQFLVARYVIKNDQGNAAVNVSQLAGDGGGLSSNINRWRAQLGQSPAGSEELAKLPAIDASGTKATLVDITGIDARSGKAARLVGAVVPVGGSTWFYKMMGDQAVVSAQKDAFIQFVQSVKY